MDRRQNTTYVSRGSYFGLDEYTGLLQPNPAVEYYWWILQLSFRTSGWMDKPQDTERYDNPVLEFAHKGNYYN